MDDSAITCDEAIESYDEETKTIPTNFNEKKAIYKMQHFYILLTFLLITIVLLRCWIPRGPVFKTTGWLEG